MLDRRRTLQGGLAALGSLSIAAPLGAWAQGKPRVKVRYNEGCDRSFSDRPTSP
jgi:hypothetical protein